MFLYILVARFSIALLWSPSVTLYAWGPGYMGETEGVKPGCAHLMSIQGPRWGLTGCIVRSLQWPDVTELTTPCLHSVTVEAYRRGQWYNLLCSLCDGQHITTCGTNCTMS
jgi:hypothetical protein